MDCIVCTGCHCNAAECPNIVNITEEVDGDSISTVAVVVFLLGVLTRNGQPTDCSLQVAPACKDGIR